MTLRDSNPWPSSRRETSNVDREDVQHAPRPDLATLHDAAETLLGASVEIVEPLSGGARRDAYRVVDDTGDRFVLRLDRDAASLRKEVALTELVHDQVPVVAVVGADLAGGLVGLPLTLGLRRGGIARRGAGRRRR